MDEEARPSTGGRGLETALALARIATACAPIAGCAHGPAAAPVEMTVIGDERGCRFEAEGRIVAAGNSSESETMLADAARRWKGRSVTVSGKGNAPYKCVGLAIFVLQRDPGLEKVGFVSEPAPEPD